MQFYYQALVFISKHLQPSYPHEAICMSLTERLPASVNMNTSVESSGFVMYMSHAISDKQLYLNPSKKKCGV